ncbi:hypothetical protein GCM10009554_61780 [Kribbella koreensis]|uniref:Uncharacterized protein n=2 Tax=Kribbella koreensis TaxID=57909 RepID=A0ABN1RCW2_9ACTN
MMHNQLLVMLVALAGAVLIFSFWKQILLILLFGVVVIFCLGVYNLTAAVL